LSALLSFPTRRSSDLHHVVEQLVLPERPLEVVAAVRPRLELLDNPGELTDRRVSQAVTDCLRFGALLDRVAALGLAEVLQARQRSEEHTSELQSRENL